MVQKIFGRILDNKVTKTLYANNILLYNYIIVYQGHDNSEKKISVWSFIEPYLDNTVKKYRFELVVESILKNNKYIPNIKVTNIDPLFTIDEMAEAKEIEDWYQFKSW